MTAPTPDARADRSGIGGVGTPAHAGVAPALETDVLVVGGGLGGVAAALAALEHGRRVVLSEEYAWLGGQLTSQAVPLDEHSWIEQFGATARYRRLRDGIREHYRTFYPLTAAARADRHLNPGNGLVSRICSEPAVGVAVLEAMLAPHRAAGRLLVLQPAVPVGAEVDGDVVTSVTLRLTREDRDVVVTAAFVVDATELGDLLPLTGAEHVTGFESRADTGEPSAPEAAQPANQQAFSWCFVIDHRDGEDHTIEPPADYEHWRTRQPDYWGAPMISLTGPDPRTLETSTRTFTPHAPPPSAVADQGKDPGDRELWTFRRIIDRDNFEPGAFGSDVVLVNWPMIDHVDGVLVDVEPHEAREHLAAARRQSLSMLYWLQTEAPRPDGGRGYPGLRLRGDLTQGPDGLAMAPYIRESRRLLTVGTVTENDLSIAVKGHGRPFTTPDTVGVGMYRIDLHPSSGGDNYLDVPSSPFEIPLGILVPRRLRNLLPAGKNVGTTHITNGAFRLHPVEWNIGEASGALAAFCLETGLTPQHVHASPAHLADYQAVLTHDGVELHWPDVVGY
ncbi:FAD-dependent oxidoreductase [Litorihabitans aurantiacus]|uniref:FAD-dependent oxidoreductase n=1 Tax=Litorihabitans aurantiacus TaxID=1930061 RepID=A0AA37UHA0_9MICO|nr:FAD-dependent oxidoreductase [Litorihabitans aurantiacus]GMA30429.1 FAD-dependent oxidoreductase [Litorihabitans aurantiacus]